jgi:hypothetical protein
MLLVLVHLGHLLRIERILDRQRMQAIVARNLVHLLVRGFTQADPVERTIGDGRKAFVQIEWAGNTGGGAAGRIGRIAARGDDRHGSLCGNAARKAQSHWQMPAKPYVQSHDTSS